MAEKRNRDQQNDNPDRRNIKIGNRQDVSRRDQSSPMREDEQEIRRGSRRSTDQNSSLNRNPQLDDFEE
jgi:hypothetical protein